MFKGKDEGIPADVHEIFFSGNFWYAASEDRDGLNKPKAVGCGNTEQEAIDDMRDLVKRFIPFNERPVSWKPEHKYQQPAPRESEPHPFLKQTNMDN
jgi:hypothetical protein